jgi:hypothetical protein
MPEDLTYGDLPPNVEAYLSRPGVNREKALQWFSLGISEPQTYNQAKLLAEAVGNSPEQAKVVAGQWQFESGGGVHMGANYNYFGIQAHTQAVRDRLIARGINVGVGALTGTPEVRDGKTVPTTNKFMAFDNAFDGFQAHRVFLETNSNYKDALLAETAKDFAKGLEKAGYATATNYGTTLYNNYVLPKEKSPLSGDTRPKSFGPTTSKVKLGTSEAGQTPEIVPALPTKPLELIETNTLGVRPEISTSPAQADYIPTNSAPVVIPASEAMQMSAPKGWFGSGKSTFNAMGGSLNNSGFHALPKEVQNKIRTNMHNKRFAEGGPMGQLTEFNSGGSHEESPLGGIPQGQAPDGGTNLVEQGETKLNAADYIFSKTLKIDKETAQEFNLKPNFVNKDFAEASKIANRKDSRRENDTIETNAIQRDLDNLMNAQEAFKQKAVEKKLAEIQALDPNALEQIAQSYQPQGMPPQGMEQGMPQEQMPQGQPSPEEMMMMQQQGQGQPPMDPAMMQQMMAQQQGAPQMPMQYGGPMSYKCGGGMYEYGGHLIDEHSYKGGGVVRAIGTGLSAAAPLIAKIPGYGTAIGAVAGGLGAGLGNVGTGADFKEVARDVAFGAGKAAASTIPGGGALVGAAEGIVNNNITDTSEKETAERLANDPNAAAAIAKEQRTNSLINTGIGALGSVVASTKKDDAITPVAPTATPAPAMPAMPVNDAMMMPTATTTMPLPMQSVDVLNKYGGSMYQYGGDLSRQFYGGGTMPGSNFNDSGNYYGLNNQGLTTNGLNTQQATGNNGLSGGQYAQMGLSAVNAGADINRINKSDMSQDAKTSAYGDTASQIGDSTVQTIFPALAPAFAAKNAYQGMLTSNVNPETGEKAYKKGFQASSNEAVTPIHTRQIKGITDFAKDTSAQNFGKMAWNLMDPGSAQLFDSAKGIWGKDKYAENQTAIDLNQASQAEAYNQQQLAAQQQQQNMINSAVQAGIAGYNQQPQDDINSNFAKYGGHQFSTAYPNFKNSAGPMGQGLSNLYAAGGMFDGPGDPPVTAAASTTSKGTLNPNYAAQLKLYNETMAGNKSIHNTKILIDPKDPVYRDAFDASGAYKVDESTGLRPTAIYKSNASAGYGGGTFIDPAKPLEYLPTPPAPAASTGGTAGFTSANQGIAMPERGNTMNGNTMVANYQYPQYIAEAANSPEAIAHRDAVNAERAASVARIANAGPQTAETTQERLARERAEYMAKNQGGNNFAMGGNMNHYFDPGGGLRRDTFGNILPYKPSLQTPTMINPWTQNNGLQSSLGLSNENYNNKSLNTPIEGFKTGQDTVKSNYENRESLGAFAANMAPIAYNAYQGFLAKQMPLPENMAAQYDPYLQNVNPQLRAAQEEAAHAYAALRNMGNPGAVAANLGNLSHQNALARAEILAAKENADNLSKTEAAKYNNKNKVDAKLMKWQLEAQMKNAKAEAQKETFTGFKDYQNMLTNNAMAGDFNAMAGEGNYSYKYTPYVQRLKESLAADKAAKDKKKEDNKTV